MTRGARGHPAPRAWSGEDCAAERVDQRTRRRAAAEDLRTGVEDENEDDEDQQDDADDHSGTEAAVRRSARIHVDLAHWNLLSLGRFSEGRLKTLASAMPRCSLLCSPSHAQ